MGWSILSLGFNKTDSKVQDANQDDILQYISHADLKSFGLIPELIGRFPVLTHLDSLDKAALLRILTEPKNAIIKQYIRLFEMDGVKLSFTKEALEFIVDKTDDLKLGARGLRSMCEAVLTNAMFEIPSQKDKISKFVVDKQYLEKQFMSSKLSQLENLNS